MQLAHQVEALRLTMWTTTTTTMRTQILRLQTWKHAFAYIPLTQGTLTPLSFKLKQTRQSSTWNPHTVPKLPSQEQGITTNKKEDNGKLEYFLYDPHLSRPSQHS
ncbi:unnamed protein product [Aspergillus oryzae]|nr:unnamed protein product [Aspergillus oryzae]